MCCLNSHTLYGLPKDKNCIPSPAMEWQRALSVAPFRSSVRSSVRPLEVLVNLSTLLVGFGEHYLNAFVSLCDNLLFAKHFTVQV